MSQNCCVSVRYLPKIGKWEESLVLLLESLLPDWRVFFETGTLRTSHTRLGLPSSFVRFARLINGKLVCKTIELLFQSKSGTSFWQINNQRCGQAECFGFVPRSTNFSWRDRHFAVVCFSVLTSIFSSTNSLCQHISKERAEQGEFRSLRDALQNNISR